eukprot:SAG11_NODE_1306_length_5245_cov_6.023513_11_plen_106_part_00
MDWNKAPFLALQRSVQDHLACRHSDGKRNLDTATQYRSQLQMLTHNQVPHIIHSSYSQRSPFAPYAIAWKTCHLMMRQVASQVAKSLSDRLQLLMMRLYDDVCVT